MFSENINRRKFLQTAACAGGGLMLGCMLDSAVRNALSDESKKDEDVNAKFTAPARHWDKKDDKFIQCKLCPRQCMVPDGQRGYCRVRENQKGEYRTLVYNRPVSLAVDPIEKKPMYHFLPGTKAFSLATAGCNLSCSFCQNWELSQSRPEELPAKLMTAKDIVDSAVKEGAPTIAFTYNEPTIFYEYMYDCAAAAKEKRIHTVSISNGFINEKPLRELAKVLTAIKIDFKAYSEKFYKDVCGAELKPVMHTLEVLKDTGIWFEIVNLIIPTMNDSASECKEMAKWISKNLGNNVPVHYTRFHPQYKLKNLPDTPVKTLETIRETAMSEGLNFVYTGNIPNHPGNNTFCPSCKKEIITRIGFFVKENKIKDGKCPYCSAAIPGVWK